MQVTSLILITGHKPVLLHELLHAYHDQRIPGGFDNPDIIRFYKQAKGVKAYVATSHMSNVKEFFACSGTSYLFGVTAQERSIREKVRDNQPLITTA